MANVSEFLEKILKARYGKDVRQSIHDSIDAINTQVTESETSALASANNAAISEANAKASEETALSAKNSAEISAETASTKAVEASESATNASNSASTASEKAEEASASANIATQKAEEASASADNALLSEQTATTKANEASASASSALSSAEIATQKAEEASASASSISETANVSKSYAVGGTGTREGEDTDNAKYYKEQAQQIAGGITGGFIPMGSITFSQLSDLAKEANSGYMYNITDDFTSDETFKDGSGIEYPAGTNVYYTADGLWDCLSGSYVLGVKGSNESAYRKGMVNITPEDIGLEKVPNVATNDQTPEFTIASIRSNIASGEKISVIFGKIAKFFTDLKNIAFSGSYNDLSDTPSIPTKTSDLTNDSNYITGINATDVTDALGYTPVSSGNVLDTLSEIEANTESGKIAGALALKEVSESLNSDITTFEITSEYMGSGNMYGKVYANKLVEIYLNIKLSKTFTSGSFATFPKEYAPSITVSDTATLKSQTVVCGSQITPYGEIKLAGTNVDNNATVNTWVSVHSFYFL